MADSAEIGVRAGAASAARGAGRAAAPDERRTEGVPATLVSV